MSHRHLWWPKESQTTELASVVHAEQWAAQALDASATRVSSQALTPIGQASEAATDPRLELVAFHDAG